VRWLASASAVLAVALALPGAARAHAIGGIRDLPVPGWLFLFGGALVLVVSFVALGVLWTRPRLDEEASTRPLPRPLQRFLLFPAVEIVLKAASFALLVLVWVAAAFGDPSPLENLAPTFVYVVFWLGLLPVVVLAGNVWAVLNPWKAAADGAAWLSERVGLRWTTLDYPQALGRWPAAALLFAFASLELAYYDPANPRVLAVAIVLYSWVTWLGMATFGRVAWVENGDGFSAYFGLLSRMAPLAVREREKVREVVLRLPLAGLTRREARPGTLAVIAVMLGSVAFDGFSRASWWQDRLYSIRASASGTAADLVGVAFNVAGLAAAVILVAAAFLAAVAGAEAVARSERPLADVFLGSLIPIALVYAVAHYLSLFIVQGQFAIPLASDPLGRDWDLLGTRDFRPHLQVLSANATWYSQVTALVVGHVFGLMVAHDRAVAVVSSARTATRTQYAMLALMILYTVGGMWLLSLS
jgi:hypothetical protein